MPRFLLLAVLALLTACGGSSGGGGSGPVGGGTGGGGTGGGPTPAGPRAADLRLTGIAIHGGLPQPTAVTVRGVTDQDGTVDAAYRVAFTLGGTGATVLPADDGVDWSADFPIASGGGAPVDAVTVAVER